MKYTFLFFTLFLLLYSCTEGPYAIPAEDYACTSVQPNTHPDAEVFQQFIETKTAAGFPGISMLIETPAGRWSGAAGQADIYNDISMQPCHSHLIGSVTKVFTAVLVHQLVMAGDLSLADSISRYLEPEIMHELANAATSTVGDLLRHTSGIPEFLDLSFSFAAAERPGKVFTAEELIAEAYDLDAVFPVGTQTDYSNTNYALLELILETVTNTSGEALYQNHIFTPLGLTETYFSQAGVIPTGISRAYLDRYDQGTLIDVTETAAIRGSMAGGIVSTTNDLATFFQALLNGNFLGPDGLALLLFQPDLPFAKPDPYSDDADSRVTRSQGFGSGLLTLETTEGLVIGFNGGYQGRKARIWYWPESEKLIIYFINGSGGAIDDESRRLFRQEMVALLFD